MQCNHYRADFMEVHELWSSSMYPCLCDGQLSERTDSHAFDSIAQTGCKDIVHYG